MTFPSAIDINGDTAIEDFLKCSLIFLLTQATNRSVGRHLTAILGTTCQSQKTKRFPLG